MKKKPDQNHDIPSNSLDRSEEEEEEEQPGSVRSVEVDVDELSLQMQSSSMYHDVVTPDGTGAAGDSGAQDQPSASGSSCNEPLKLKISMEARELSAIARELDEVDRLAKEQHKLPQSTFGTKKKAPNSPAKEAKSPVDQDIKTNNTKSPGSSTTEREKKERDLVAQDDEINPVLLRHLAAELQPGAFASHTRPPNLNIPQRPNVQEEEEEESVLPLTLPPAAAMPPLSSESVDIIEASLVVPGTSLENPDNDDPEQPLAEQNQASISSSASSSSSLPQPLQGASNGEHHVTMVEAKDAGFKDYIKNPTFCLFLVGYLLAIITIVGLVVGVILLQEEIGRLQVQLDEASEPTVRADILTLRDAGLITDVAAQLFAQYITPRGQPQQQQQPTSNTNVDPPQYKAYQWLVLQYPEHVRLENYRLVQIYSLATFFYALQGTEWAPKDRGAFLYPKAHECDWFASFSVQMCEPTGPITAQEVDNQQDDDDDLVDVGNETMAKTLSLSSSSSNMVVGSTKQDEIALTAAPLSTDRREIRLLQILGNQQYRIPNIHGYLAPEVGFLTMLQSIDIGYTSLDADLTDMLPKELEQLMHFTTLKYESNFLGSTIPTRIARLQQLQVLALPGNELTGPIPSEMGTMTNLVSLQLENNQLSDKLPSELGLLSAKLQALDMSANKLVGEIPSELAQLQALRVLTLHSNSIRGSIPSELARLPALTSLTLHSNPIIGTLPTELGTFANIVTLNLRNLELTGVLPSEIGLLAPTLEELFLHGNKQLVGSIPTEFGLLTNLKRLFLYDTALEGTLPWQLCNMTSLSHLVVDCLAMDCHEECVCRCSGT